MRDFTVNSRAKSTVCSVNFAFLVGLHAFAFRKTALAPCIRRRALKIPFSASLKMCERREAKTADVHLSSVVFHIRIPPPSHRSIPMLVLSEPRFAET